MSAYVFSLVMGFSDTDKTDANRLAWAMGHVDEGGDEFTVPLSPTGEAPATHWLCHTWCIPEFAEMLVEVSVGTLPEPEAGGTWEDYGLSYMRVGQLMQSAIVSCIEGADPVTHVNDVLASAGLQRVN